MPKAFVNAKASGRLVLFLGLVSATLLAAGCSYRVRSQLIETPASPIDLYRCVQLELGRMGYAIVGADSASGWLHAQKRIESRWDVKRAEIYATVIPDEAQTGAHLQLTDNSYAETDADRIRSACTSTESDPGVVGAFAR